MNNKRGLSGASSICWSNKFVAIWVDFPLKAPNWFGWSCGATQGYKWERIHFAKTLYKEGAREIGRQRSASCHCPLPLKRHRVEEHSKEVGMSPDWYMWLRRVKGMRKRSSGSV
jgi:hypothetical protein